MPVVSGRLGAYNDLEHLGFVTKVSEMTFVGGEGERSSQCQGGGSGHCWQSLEGALRSAGAPAAGLALRLPGTLVI